MFLKFHDALLPTVSGDAIDVILPRLLDLGIRRVADGGGGVGNWALKCAKFMREHLREACAEASIHCYEPLPENLIELRKQCAAERMIEIRPFALAAEAGSAVFNVPTRMNADAGAGWTVGTSFAGSLGERADAAEKIEVRTLRLQDEGTFDFVKLDLQGGELGALKGLGDAIDRVKVLYVEYQFFRDESAVIKLLMERGFTVYFDRLQFGLKAGARALDFDALERLGLKVSYAYLPTSAGMPLVLRGRFLTEADPVAPNGRLRDPHAFQRAQVGYLQTDLLALHPSIADQIGREHLKVVV